MKSINYKRIISIILIVAVSLGIGLKLAVWNNTDLLCKIAEGFDEPSTPYYFVIERIYKLSEKRNISKKITQYLSKDENRYLHNIYIRILGVLGDKESLHELEQIYIKYQHDKRYKVTVYYVIKSMGLIGDKEIAPLLETLLRKYVELNVQISGSNIASALYLITGNSNYHFTNSSGERQKLILTNNLTKAREVIVSSKGRRRNFEEMKILDKVYRPSTWQD
jgi:hypothetical protein